MKESNGTGGSAPGNKQGTLIFLCEVLDCENSRLAERHPHPAPPFPRFHSLSLNFKSPFDDILGPFSLRRLVDSLSQSCSVVMWRRLLLAAGGLDAWLGGVAEAKWERRWSVSLPVGWLGCFVFFYFFPAPSRSHCPSPGASLKTVQATRLLQSAVTSPPR